MCIRDSLASIALDNFETGPHAGRGLGLRVNRSQIAHVNGCFLGDDAAGACTATGGAGLGVTRHLVDALHQHTLGVEIDRDDPALLAAVAAVLLRSTTDDLYEVTLLDFHLGHGLQHLRGERDDLHELLLAQLATDGPEDGGTTRVAIGLEEDGGVLIKLDVSAVGAATFLRRPNHHRFDDITLLDGAPGDGLLDGGDDN